MSKMFSELSRDVQDMLRDPTVEAKQRINSLIAGLQAVQTALSNQYTNTTALRNTIDQLAADNPSDTGILSLKAVMDRYISDGQSQYQRVSSILTAINGL